MAIFLRKLYKDILVQPGDVTIWIEGTSSTTYTHVVSNTQAVIERLKTYGVKSPYTYSLSAQSDGLGGFRFFAIALVPAFTGGTIPISVPLDASWITSTGTTTTTDGFYKTYTPSPYFTKDSDLGWNASAVSDTAISVDGEVSFRIDPNSAGVVIGFNQDAGGVAYFDIDYAIYAVDGLFRPFENGVAKHNFASFILEDVFTIRRLGVKVEYFKNDVLFYTSLTDSIDANLVLDVSLYAGGDNVINASVTDLPDSISGGTLNFNASSSMDMPAYSVTNEQQAGGADFSSSSSTAMLAYEIDNIVYPAPVNFNSSSQLSEKRTETIVNFNSTSLLQIKTDITTVSLNPVNFNSSSLLQETLTETVVDFLSTSSLSEKFYVGVDSVNIMKPAVSYASDTESIGIAVGFMKPAVSYAYDTALDNTVDVSFNTMLPAYSYAHGVSGGVGDSVNNMKPALAYASDTENIGIASGFMKPAVSYATGLESIENYAFVTLPELIAQGTGSVFAIEDNTIEIPELSVYSYGVGYADIEIKTLTIDATGDLGSYGSASVVLPELSISGNILIGTLANASVVLPRLRGYAYGGGYADVKLPKFSANATGEVSVIANADIKLPALLLNGSGTLIPTGSGSILLPELSTIWGEGQISLPLMILSGGTEIAVNNLIAYSINVSSAETTKYTNYDFDYIHRFFGKYYGFKNDGVYLLEGQDDNGTAIDCRFKTSMMDFDTALQKRVPYMYLDSDNKTIIKTYTDDKLQGSYESSFGGRRTKLPRGSKGRFWEFEVLNKKGNEFKIGSLEAFAQVLSRKV